MQTQRQEHKEDLERSNKETRALVSELASEHAETRRWVLATLFALVLLIGSTLVTVLVNMLPSP